MINDDGIYMINNLNHNEDNDEDIIMPTSDFLEKEKALYSWLSSVLLVLLNLIENIWSGN